jgi:DNA-binding winged helix-turn-helix (wHTH) protein/Flp pilus assembly protein TadD
VPALGEQIEFGPFTADPVTFRLCREGEEIELRRQAFQALRVLLDHPGQYVDYDQMIRYAWEGTVVSRHTVAVTVGEVKKALQEFGAWITYRPKLGYRLDVPRSDELIKRGWHFWHHHTREGFEKALCCFQKAANEDESDFRAYEGLAATYLNLGTYGMRRPAEMYAKFREAHAHAVSLGGMTPELRADLAQGLHVFEHRIAEAECELLAAQKEKPKLAAIQIRLAMLYATSGRPEEAVCAINDIRAKDALCPLLAAVEIAVHFCRRDFETAAACGERAIELHPYMQLARLYYAKALEYLGKADAALVQYEKASLMSPELPWVRAMQGHCLAVNGRRQEAVAILDDLAALRRMDYVDGYHFAILLDALGNRDEAFAELRRAHEDSSPFLFLLDADPKLDPLRSDSRFAQLRDRVFGVAVRQSA